MYVVTIKSATGKVHVEFERIKPAQMPWIVSHAERMVKEGVIEAGWVMEVRGQRQ